MTTDLRPVVERWEQEKQGNYRGSPITASAMGALCDKQLAYTRQGVTPTDSPDPLSVATVGSLIHEGMRGHYEAMGYMTEVAGPHGTCDAWNPVARIVRDLKTLSRSKFDTWADLDGPHGGVWDQVAVYAADRIAAYHLDDDVPVTLVVDALCRETGRIATYTYDTVAGYCRDVLARLRRKDEEILAIDLPATEPPRESPDDWLCLSCPFRTACWDGWTEPFVSDTRDHVALERAAAAYATGSQMERDGKAMKKDARRALVGVEGQFGEYEVHWVERDMPAKVVEPYTMAFPKITRRVRS